MPLTSLAGISRMAGQIVSHTALVVWGVLALLIALGLGQLRQRRAGVARVTVLPLAAMALSLWGTASLFGHAHLLLVLLAWIGAAAATFFAIARNAPPRSAAFDAAARTLLLPGSWAPLALMLGIFSLRYATNVALAIHPGLAADALFATAIALTSGAFTGAFGGRAARLWKLMGGPPWPMSRATA